MTSATTEARHTHGRHVEGHGLIVFASVLLVILGALQLLAAAGVVAGNQLARWFAVAVLGLNAIDQMFFIPAYPLWSLVIIAVDVVALYGLCAPMAAAPTSPPDTPACVSAAPGQRGCLA